MVPIFKLPGSPPVPIVESVATTTVTVGAPESAEITTAETPAVLALDVSDGDSGQTPDASAALVAVPSEAVATTAVVVGEISIPMEGKRPRVSLQRDCLDEFDDFAVDPKSEKSYVVLRSKGYPELLQIGSALLDARIRSNARALGQRLKKRDLDDANADLLGRASDNGLRIDLYPRVCPLPDRAGVEIDLCDGAGTTVVLAPVGVQVLRGTSPTLFRRSPSAMALPVPADHGDITLLRKYVNLLDGDLLLFLAWITYTITRPKVEASKYLVLVLKGGQGSGKSFACKVTQQLIDPSSVGAQMLPSNPRDLALMLQAKHLMVVDNMRDLTTEMSDTLCIASTGGALATRKLYTDDEQKALHLHGAMILNGIHPFVGQSDFADRCMVLELSPLAGTARRSEGQMLAEFAHDHPVILRGLYELTATTMAHLPNAEVVVPSRMLDFCRWLGATEMARGLPVGTLQQRYADIIKDAQLESLLDNPLAVVILEFAECMEVPEWAGTPTAFYDKLSLLADFASQKTRTWPTSAAVLSKRLYGLQAPLSAQGVFISLGRGKDRRIVVRNANPITGPKPGVDLTDSLEPIRN